MHRHGYETRIASRTPEKLRGFAQKSGIKADIFRAVAEWAEGLVLAVLGRGAEEAVAQCGETNIAGKLMIDTTNPISHEPPDGGVIGYFTAANDSLMEQLQRAFPAAHFVKAFNSVGSALMVNPSFPTGRPSMFYCGNDEGAKRIVARVIEQFGWQPADMGGVTAARPIEALAQLWCIPGFLHGRWNDHAFGLLTR